MKDFTLEIRSQGSNPKFVVLECDIPEGESSVFPKTMAKGKKANRYAENAPGWISVIKTNHIGNSEILSEPKR